MKIKDSRLEKTSFTARELIADETAKIIFTGRSNVGKSSLINKLLSRKNLARTSSTPGKTLSINYYSVRYSNSHHSDGPGSGVEGDGIDRTCYFVDLPGYGYARVSKKEIQRVKSLMSEFFRTVTQARLVVLLIDSRRGFMDSDLEILSQILDKKIKLLTVLTKSDKLRHSELNSQKKILQDKFDLKVMSFTVKSRMNREDMLEHIRRALME